MKKVYVLHEYGSNSHYNGLQALCNQNGIELVFREFRFLHLIGSGIEHRNIQRILKQPVNFVFLLSLLFTKGRTIVLGMHPYDWKLPILKFLLRTHRVYYHSSFTAWNPGEMEKYKHTSERKINRIKGFIRNKTIHIFAVTQKAKLSVCSFTGVSDDKVSVVYHSYTYPLKPAMTPPINHYIYVGRMDKQKGIEEICDYFSLHPSLILTLIGDGDDMSYVRRMVSKYSNIQYEGYVKGLSNLMPYYQKNAYFILNSKRTKEWEELFGQVLIEAMSCGCVPVSVNHSGPKEIIYDLEDGFLFEENQLENMLDRVVALDEKHYLQIRAKAIKKGQQFSASSIAKRWESILDNESH